MKGCDYNECLWNSGVTRRNRGHEEVKGNEGSDEVGKRHHLWHARPCFHCRAGSHARAPRHSHGDETCFREKRFLIRNQAFCAFTQPQRTLVKKSTGCQAFGVNTGMNGGKDTVIPRSRPWSGGTQAGEQAGGSPSPRTRRPQGSEPQDTSCPWLFLHPGLRTVNEKYSQSSL